MRGQVSVAHHAPMETTTHDVGGAARGDGTTGRPPLRRPRRERMVAGVAAGLAAHLDLDVLLVRVVLAALAICGGLGVPLYLAAWLLVPEEGSEVSIIEQLLHGDGIGAWR